MLNIELRVFFILEYGLLLVFRSKSFEKYVGRARIFHLQGLGEQIQPDILEVLTYETDSFQPYFLSLNACPYSLNFHL